MKEVKCIYRYFREAWQADALLSGDVWLSTLETCRRYEDAEQGDQEEAVHTYQIGSAAGYASEPHMRLIIQSLGGIRATDDSSFVFHNCQSVNRIPDAFVLCTSLLFDVASFAQTFGNYCVEIQNPKRFFQSTTLAMERVGQPAEAACGPIRYARRSHEGLSASPGPLGFVKPEVPYAVQKEVRMLWIQAADGAIKPFLLRVPAVGALCRRVA